MIREWVVFKNVIEVRSFLGLCLYYRKFIRNFVLVVKLLYKLMEKGRIFLWIEECDELFRILKEFFILFLILVYFDRIGLFVLDMDVSEFGLDFIIDIE